MSEEEKNNIIEVRKTKKIRFDVFMDDRGTDDDWGDPMISNVSYIEACVYLGESSYFSFKVTEHGNPSNVFMSGYCHKDMRSAEEGDERVSLGWATPEQLEQIYKTLRMRATTEPIGYTCNKCGGNYKRKSSLDLCINCETEFESKLAKDD